MFDFRDSISDVSLIFDFRHSISEVTLIFAFRDSISGISSFVVFRASISGISSIFVFRDSISGISSIFVIRASISEVTCSSFSDFRDSISRVSSIFEIQYQKLVRFSRFTFDIRTGLWLFFILYWPKTPLTFRMLPNIMFPISKLTLSAQFRISKCYFVIRISIFDILTVTDFHDIMVKNLLLLILRTWYSVTFRMPKKAFGHEKQSKYRNWISKTENQLHVTSEIESRKSKNKNRTYFWNWISKIENRTNFLFLKNDGPK